MPLTEQYKVYRVSGLIDNFADVIIENITTTPSNTYYVVSGTLDELLCEGNFNTQGVGYCYTDFFTSSEIYIIMDYQGLTDDISYSITVDSYQAEY